MSKGAATETNTGELPPDYTGWLASLKQRIQSAQQRAAPYVRVLSYLLRSIPLLNFTVSNSITIITIFLNISATGQLGGPLPITHIITPAAVPLSYILRAYYRCLLSWNE